MTETNFAIAVDDSLQQTISADSLYDLLSHQYRRFVLAALVRRDEPTTVATLAEEIAEERGGKADTTEVDTQSAIRIQLYHVHLPKLAEADLIEFDPSTKMVAPPEDDLTPEAVAPLLPEFEDNHQRA